MSEFGATRWFPPPSYNCELLGLGGGGCCLFKFTPVAMLLTTGEFQTAGWAESWTDDSREESLIAHKLTFFEGGGGGERKK